MVERWSRQWVSTELTELSRSSDQSSSAAKAEEVRCRSDRGGDARHGLPPKIDETYSVGTLFDRLSRIGSSLYDCVFALGARWPSGNSGFPSG